MEELGFQDVDDLKDTIQELNSQLKRLEPIEVIPSHRISRGNSDQIVAFDARYAI